MYAAAMAPIANNAETRLFASLSADQKIAFAQLCYAVYGWQKHMVEEAGEDIAEQLAVLPESLANTVRPTKRELSAAFRGDYVRRMKQAPGGWVLPDYKIAGFGNENVVKFFGRFASPFFISGKDLVSMADAVSTDRLYRFVYQARKALDRFSEENRREGWAYAHDEIGDDESEIIVVSPRMRVFTNAEKERGMSRNVRFKNPL